MFSLGSLFPFELPTLRLPTLSLPANIQRRFVAFILRRSLGRFVKPGQLDDRQIDSQIGSGFIEISDVELSDEGVNELLKGLPVRLRGGSIGKITVNVPWSNIWWGPLEVRVESLHAGLVLTKIPPAPPTPIDLTASVTNAAETFVHHELGPEENRVLRQTIPKPRVAPPREPVAAPAGEPLRVPGGFDAFGANDDVDDPPDEVDEAEEVSFLTSLTESLLSRLRVAVVDTSVTIIHDNAAELKFHMAGLHFETNDSTEAPPPTHSDSTSDAPASAPLRTAVTRTLSLTGLSASIRILQPLPISPPPHTPFSFHAPVDSDESSEDESVGPEMYQSTLSIQSSASMYQSAASLPSRSMYLPRVFPSRPSPPPNDLPVFTRILTIGEPVTVEVSSHPTASYRLPANANRPKASISGTVGVIAVALRSEHVRELLDLAQFVPPSPPSPPPSSRPVPVVAPTIKDTMSISFKLRGAVALILGSPGPRRTTPDSSIDAFFERPLLPFSGWNAAHTRIQVDHLEVSLHKRLQFPSDSNAPQGTSDPFLETQLGANIRDVFALYFAAKTPSGSDFEASGSVSPLFIFDPHLQSSILPRTHVFPLLDTTSEWERPGNVLRPSLWRVKLPQATRKDASGPSGSGANEPRQVISVTSIDAPGDSARDVEITLLPMHLFVDLNMLADHIIPFLDGMTPIRSPLDDQDDENDAGSIGSIEDDDIQDSVHVDGAVMETPRARQLNLEPESESPSAKLAGGSASSNAASPRISLHCPVIRIEIRPPPSNSVNAVNGTRSGTSLLDLYGLTVRTGPPRVTDSGRGRRTGGVSFGPREQTLPSARSAGQDAGQLLADIEWNELLLAFASIKENRATALLSLSSLTSLAPGGAETGLPEADVPLLPRLTIRQKSASPASSLSPAGELAKLYVDCVLPQLRISLSKPALDGLQLWADDLSQWAARMGSSESPAPSESGTELIGSRFFARRAAKSLSSSTTASSDTRSSALPKESPPMEVVVSTAVTEVLATLWVPRKDSAVFDTPVARPFKINASDVAVVLTSKPQGKNETVVDLAVLDFRITDTQSTNEEVALLYLTRQRAMNSELKPMINMRFASVSVSDAVANESRIRVSLHGFTFVMPPDIDWTADLGEFAKAPPGAFETVVPSERTVLSLHISNCSIQLKAPSHPGSIVGALNDLDLSTDIAGNSPELAVRLRVTSAWILAVDNIASLADPKITSRSRTTQASDYWRRLGFARLLEVRDLALHFRRNTTVGSVLNKVEISQLDLLISLCTDTMSSVGAFITSFSQAISPPAAPRSNQGRREGPVLRRDSAHPLTASLDEEAFSRPPEFTADADMIRDDLPSNTEYLEDAFGAAAGFRDLTTDDLEDFDDPDSPLAAYSEGGSAFNTAQETIRILDPLGVKPVYYYFDNLPPEDLTPRLENVVTSIRARNCNATLSLHSGFDWKRTQSIVKEETEAMRRRLQKIRKLVTTGEAPYEEIEGAHTTLFNSVYIGLPPEADDLDGDALLAAIDEELDGKGDEDETASQGSWETLDKLRIPSTIGGTSLRHPQDAHQAPHQRLTRSKRPSIQFCFSGLQVEHDINSVESETASRLLATIKDVEILDHLRTSTWRKFLTQMRADSRGQARETDSSMVRLELVNVRPIIGDPSEESRLRLKILPLRLHVDQDALDFIKHFFAFEDPDAPPPVAPEPQDTNPTFFQHVDIFPVELKLDYKPKRVDYRALREGKTIELMNFFHFEGSEMTLRHIEMFGETGWGPMLEKLNDLWSPDVKAHQLAEVISGVEPIRSVVNVGSGVADLVLLPIEQYRKDGRVMRGMQKGATSFVKTTAIEALTIGARLANGTQIVLEQAEGILSGRNTSASAQAELESSLFLWNEDNELDEEDAEYGYGGGGEDFENMTMSVADLSRYAHQPTNVKEGVQAAYKSLGRNLGEAAQTILAVPIEVYERSGTEGPVRAVIRALPVAVLKPMIGASEAVSKTLLGLRGTLDPDTQANIDAKYKRL